MAPRTNVSLSFRGNCRRTFVISMIHTSLVVNTYLLGPLELLPIELLYVVVPGPPLPVLISCHRESGCGALGWPYRHFWRTCLLYSFERLLAIRFGAEFWRTSRLRKIDVTSSKEVSVCTTLYTLYSVDCLKPYKVTGHSLIMLDWDG